MTYYIIGITVLCLVTVFIALRELRLTQALASDNSQAADMYYKELLDQCKFSLDQLALIAEYSDKVIVTANEMEVRQLEGEMLWFSPKFASKKRSHFTIPKSSFIKYYESRNN